MSKIEEVLESLSPTERKILPIIRNNELLEQKNTGLDNTSILRALQFLENKKLIEKETKKTKIVELDENGKTYLAEGLPERKLLRIVMKEKSLTVQEAKSKTNINEQEFSASLGALKGKAIIKLEAGRITLTGNKTEAEKQFPEEELMSKLPQKFDTLEGTNRLAYEKLRARKGIIKTREITDYTVKLTPLGEDIARCNVDSSYENMIEQVTPEIISNESWKGKKFRRYDIKSRVPEISGGKKHFVNQAVEYGKKVWMDMGFQEMSGRLTQTAFWNFDALFQPQDHPAREMQDTFYIKDAAGKLPEKEIVESVKDAHEGRIAGSKGWNYKWKEEEARRVILRTHTTALTAQAIAALRRTKNKEGKFFSVGMVFRNETVDWSHGFQFNQTEGIVAGRGLTFQSLLGYLKEFYKKMGYEKVRFRPSYFPYTEPSVEVDVWHTERKIWLELGGAGVFRPEMIIPLLGENIPVIGWGLGFDRPIMGNYNITDLREMYENDLTKLRKKKMWMK